MPPFSLASTIAIVLFYLYAIMEKFPVQVIRIHRNAPRPHGAGFMHGGRSSCEKRISPK